MWKAMVSSLTTPTSPKKQEVTITATAKFPKKE
jgi:hypothetical protein